jgi:hypothetical protein
MRVYKIVFDANNKSLICKFFRDPFIRDLWPFLLPLIDESLLDEYGDQQAGSLLETYKEITNFLLN